MKITISLRQQSSWLLLAFILNLEVNIRSLSNVGATSSTNNKLRLGAPKLLPLTLEDSYSEGSSAEMFCIVSNGKNHHDLEYHWFKDGHKLVTDSDGQISIKTEKGHSILNILNININNSGNYTCQVENSYGHDGVTASLIVVVDLKWIEEPHDIRVSIGQSAKLNCSAKGQPQPTIKWTKLNGNINETMNLKQINGMLMFSDATQQNSGLYECVASNKIEPDLRKVVKVDIQGGPRLLPMALEDSYIEGSKAEMFCIVSSGSNHDLEYQWSKDGSELDKNKLGHYAIRFEQAHSILKINNITSDDAGNYTCRVENSFGYDIASANLVVVVELRWIEEPHDIRVSIGQSAKLNCSAKGQPQPTIKWTKLNGNINETMNLKQINGMLMFSDATQQNSGLYECVASNKIEPDLRKVVKVDIQGK